MTLDVRRLGRTGLTVTATGLGTHGHRPGIRGTDRSAAARAIHVAIEAGCQLVDAASDWGDAEEVVGVAVRELHAADRVVVSTHVYPLLRPASTEFGDWNPVERALPPAEVQRAVEQSLRATKLEAIPLVWLDGWRDAWLDDSGWPILRGTLERLVREGKALAWGLGALPGRPDDAVRGAAEPVFAAVAARYSLFDRAAETLLVPAAMKAEAGFVARAPLADGALTGEVGPGRVYWPGDERGQWSPAILAAIVPDLARLCGFVREVPPAARATDGGRAVLETLRRHPEVAHRTLTELALAYVTGARGVTAALVGARSVEHARAAVEASARYLVPALPDAIRTALDATAWGQPWYRPTRDGG